MNLSSSSLITSSNQVRSKSHTLFPDKELIHLVKSGMNTKIRKKLKDYKVIDLNQLTTCTIHCECLLIEKDHMENLYRNSYYQNPNYNVNQHKFGFAKDTDKRSTTRLTIIGSYICKNSKKN